MNRAPKVTPAVAGVFAEFDDDARDLALKLRSLIYEEAARTAGVGELEETLRWGQAAYVTAQSRSGATIRLAIARGDAAAIGIYTSCNTPLVADFEAAHGDEFEYDGGRAVHVPLTASVPESELRGFVREALTYHLRKRAPEN